MVTLLDKLQTIDRRWIYLCLALACGIPFIRPFRLPTGVSPETQRLYDTIEKCPAGKVVLVDSAWDQGSQGENEGQVEVVFDHLFRKKIPFVVVSNDNPLAPRFAEEVIARLVRKKYPDRKYGTDWVTLGLFKGDWQGMQQISKDIRRQYPRDYYGNSLDDSDKLPLMQSVRNIDDIYLVFSCTYTPSENWIPFVHGVYGTHVGFGCTSIQSTTYYRYILSGQLSGMLVGVRGAAEYDSILHPDMADRDSQGTRLIVPLAFGQLVIILAVVIGNIGYFASLRKERRDA